MHTVELLDQVLVIAEQLGYGVRQEWLGGSGGGSCEIKGKPWLFVDLSLAPREQCQQVVAVLRADPRLAECQLSPDLQAILCPRRAA